MMQEPQEVLIGHWINRKSLQFSYLRKEKYT